MMQADQLTYGQFFDRDLSWLSFNARVLDEAAKPTVPLVERARFLSIYSSNLDEFYRVRMPILQALKEINDKDSNGKSSQTTSAKQADEIIQGQLSRFGQILREIIAGLRKKEIYLHYSEPPNWTTKNEVTNYFYSQVLAFLRPVYLSKQSFFPENNELYFIVNLQDEQKKEHLAILNIPSNKLSRFFSYQDKEGTHIILLDDIVRYHLSSIFKSYDVISCYSFKITRDAELELKDEYPGDLADQIEKQILKRDKGIATRFLHQPEIPLRTLQAIIKKLGLENSRIVEGGRYHNLKDLFLLPVSNEQLLYKPLPGVPHNQVDFATTIFDQVCKRDFIFHFPYHNYDAILRFFNEAAADPEVTEIYLSIYRVASDSRIINALINAAKGGKKVTVVVELKARFDEANNLKWAKNLIKAGATIIYSSTSLKVHAKIALIKRKEHGRIIYYGLLGTGNFNEGTAKVYTDHILMTANKAMLREMELLFMLMAKKEKPDRHETIKFEHLLVSRFNLQERFLQLIERETNNAKQGLPSSITIKMNNLEERELISSLYSASNAGVKIRLIVRGVCCLVPGVKNQSENITVTRIVGRYLEHGRVYIFNNNNDPEVFLGSADWMNRNIYRRIEVCYPVADPEIKQEITDIIQLQLKDNVQAVFIDSNLNNVPVKNNEPPVDSQMEIYKMIESKIKADASDN